MAKYNLHAESIGPLTYPHFTKVANGEAYIVTHPNQLLRINDVIYAEAGYKYIEDKKITEILEQREARGEHSVDFVPVFQKLKVVAI